MLNYIQTNSTKYALGKRETHEMDWSLNDTFSILLQIIICELSILMRHWWFHQKKKEKNMLYYVQLEILDVYHKLTDTRWPKIWSNVEN